MQKRNATTMSLEEKVLFALVRAGLWEREIDDLSLFPISAFLWNEIFRLAKEQTVTGLAYRGLHHLPNEFLPDDLLMMRWVAAMKQIERSNDVSNTALSSLHKTLTEAPLQPILLKGQGIAVMYRFPELRECGDIDLYFPTSQEKETAAEIIRKKGCKVTKMPDGSDEYQWQGVEIEHHPAMFDLCSPLSKRYLARLTNSEGSTTKTEIKADGVSIKVSTPAPLQNLLMLNAHILKHVMGHGIGIRQFCDIAMAYHTLKGSYSQQELAEAYKRTGLLKWSRCLHALLIEHIGIDEKDLPDLGKKSPTPPALLQLVLSGGNFGKHNGLRGDASQPAWKRKMNTLQAFVRNSRFSMTVAPVETVCNALQLMKGNL